MGTGGALEAVDFQTENLPLPPELLRDKVAELLWRLAYSRGGAFDLLPMFIRTCSEHRIKTLHSLEAFDRVGSNSGIRMAEMRSGVHVVDRSGEVVFHSFFFKYASAAAASTWGSGVPVRCAMARQSSYSGINAAEPETFPRTAPHGVSTSIIMRSCTRRSAAYTRKPRVDVSANTICASFSWSSGLAMTRSSVPGRFFFIWMGERETSSAPSSINRSSA